MAEVVNEVRRLAEEAVRRATDEIARIAVEEINNFVENREKLMEEARNYRCLEDIYLNGTGNRVFTKGRVYSGYVGMGGLFLFLTDDEGFDHPKIPPGRPSCVFEAME
jgi:hypothetical protein